MKDPGQRVGGRLRTFDEQNRIMADFNWSAIEPLHEAITQRMPEWSEQSTRTTVYGYMLVHGCTARQAATQLLLETGLGS